jgi:phenylacetic acid degradation operon negative regulatory protein
VTLSVSPLSARSVALNLLLGSRPPRLPVRDLTALGEVFEIADSTMRTALSRMVSAGDLIMTDAVYGLSPRHLQRQAETERAIRPRRRPYDGMWRMAVVADRGRPAGRRTALRAQLTRSRFGELREGVWLRPGNIDDLSIPDDTELRVFTTVPDDDRGLCRELWDLDAWAAEARSLLAALAPGHRPIERLTAAAAIVRHLCTDPVLPDELAPERWPAEDLRWAYEDYRTDLSTTYLSGSAVPMKESR